MTLSWCRSIIIRERTTNTLLYIWMPPVFLTPTHLLLPVEPLVRPYSWWKKLRDIANFICKILQKILRLLQSVLWFCKKCFVYNYRLFFFEKYLVELAKIHNFANVKTLIAGKNPWEHNKNATNLNRGKAQLNNKEKRNHILKGNRYETYYFIHNGDFANCSVSAC